MVYQAVEDKWPFEPNEEYPEFNKAVVETSDNGCKTVIAETGNWVDAKLIAAALNFAMSAQYVDYLVRQKHGTELKT